jgi:hypothetical protein
MVVATEQWGLWHLEYSYCNLKDSINTAIIKEYENQTGISARSVDDLAEAFQIKNDVEDQRKFESMEVIRENKVLRTGNKVLKVGMFVVPPAAFVLGVVVATKINK